MTIDEQVRELGRLPVVAVVELEYRPLGWPQWVARVRRLGHPTVVRCSGETADEALDAVGRLAADL